MQYVVFQFKITLEEIKPTIWRRIQVLDSYTFWDLHVAIQDAMGWNDSHLHEFTVTNPVTDVKEHIGIPDEEGFDEREVLAGWNINIKDYFTHPSNQKVSYLYDFGDSWQHQVEFEGEYARHSGKYPICLAGERACPPDDVGGSGGYENFLTAILDPHHEEHEEFLQWIGGKFDPEKFLPHQVKFDNPKKRWKNAFESENT